MTSGYTGPFPPVGALSTGPAYGRQWSGSDGKYEPGPNGTRIKWNPLTLRAASSLCGRNTCTLHWKDLWGSYPDGSEEVVPSLDLQGSNNDSGWDLPDNALKQLALTRLSEKVKGFDFNLGVELGQLHQTVDLLSGNLVKLGRAALALRHGDFATAARQLGSRPKSTRLKASDISGRWLELQYGWLPLLGSSFDAAKAFEEISQGPRSAVFKVSAVQSKSHDFSLIGTNMSCLATVKVGRRIQYEMYEEMSVPRQLGLLDPLSIAWELTPWSFVVDWFYPIGTYLDNLNQIPKLKGRFLVTDFMKVPKQKLHTSWASPGFWGPRWGITRGEDINLTWGLTKMDRSFSESPPPVPAPKFVFGLNSTKRFWNAVGLAHQRFRF